MEAGDWQGIALVITSLGTLVASVGAVWVSIRNSRHIAVVDAKVGPVAEKIDQLGVAQTRQGENLAKIETATNSMKDALMKKTEEAALAQGKDEGRQEAKIEKAIGEAAVKAAAVVAGVDVIKGAVTIDDATIEGNVAPKKP